MKLLISFPKQRSVMMRTAFKTMPTIPMDLLLKGKHDIGFWTICRFITASSLRPGWKKTRSRLQFFLPSYSPELNPDEYFHGDLKHCIRSGLPARTEKALAKKTRSFMRKLQNRPKHVSNYFKYPNIAYAA